MTATAATSTFTEGDAAVGLFSSVGIDTIEDGQKIQQLHLTVSGLQDGRSEQLVIDGTTISLVDGEAGTVSGSLAYSVSLSDGVATITLTDTGLTAAEAIALIEGIGYQNTSQDPDASDRLITLTGIEDSGGTANKGIDTTTLSIASTVHVLTVNDAPLLAARSVDPTFTENGAAVSLFDGTGIDAVEANQKISSLSFTISGLHDGGDEQLIIDGTTVSLGDAAKGDTAGKAGVHYSVSIVDDTATVVLTSTSGLAADDAAALVDGLKYQNLSESPDVSDRLVTLTSIQDNGGTDLNGVDTTDLSLLSTIHVAAANDAPTVAHVLADHSYLTGQSVNLVVPPDTFADVDKGDTLRYVATLADGHELPSWLKFDPTTQTFTSPSARAGTISVMVTAIDGSKASVSDTFDIVVTNAPPPPPNYAPVLAMAIADQTASEDQPFSLHLLSTTFTDVDGDALTYTATLENGAALPAWLHFNAATRTFSGTPDNLDVGAVSVKVTAADGSGASASDVFLITVAAVNDIPKLDHSIDAQTATEDAPFHFQFAADTFSDEESGTNLTFAATLADGSALPSWLIFDAASRIFSGTPLNEDVGALPVRLTVTDDKGASVSTTFQVTIANVNDAPELDRPLADQSASEGVAFAFVFDADAFADADMDDVLTYSAALEDGTPLPTWLVFDAATRTFSGTPGHPDVGMISVVVTATDKAGASASDMFDIAIAGAGGDPGAIVLSNSAIAENSAKRTLVGVLSVPDADPDAALTYTLVHNPGHAFAIRGGRLVVAHGADLDFETRHHYRIKVDASDGQGNDYRQAFVIDVTDVLENPRGTRHDDVLRGDGLDNRIRGRAGNDILKGMKGDDRLDGGRGDDRLTGGAGADTFVFGNHHGRDVVTDFRPGEGDRIDLGASGIASFHQLVRHHVEVHGDSLIISTSDGAEPILRHTETGQLASHQFDFDLAA